MAHSHLISLHGAKEIKVSDELAAGSPYRTLTVKLDDGTDFTIDLFAAKDSELAKEIESNYEAGN